MVNGEWMAQGVEGEWWRLKWNDWKIKSGNRISREGKYIPTLQDYTLFGFNDGIDQYIDS